MGLVALSPRPTHPRAGRRLLRTSADQSRTFCEWQTFRSKVGTTSCFASSQTPFVLSYLQRTGQPSKPGQRKRTSIQQAPLHVAAMVSLEMNPSNHTLCQRSTQQPAQIGTTWPWPDETPGCAVENPTRYGDVVQATQTSMRYQCIARSVSLILSGPSK